MYPNDPFATPPRAPRGSGSNGLGLAGFIVSLVGLISCGCLSIFGIILSGIALTRRPRGFAIAGLIIGVLGVLMLMGGLLVMWIGGGFTLIVAMGDGYQVAEEVAAYRAANNNALPASWADFPNGPVNDKWNQPYHYRILPDNQRIELRSDGPDGTPRTRDDVFITIDGDEVDANIGQPPPR